VPANQQVRRCLEIEQRGVAAEARKECPAGSAKDRSRIFRKLSNDSA
jgi:hypothetical protein